MQGTVKASTDEIPFPAAVIETILPGRNPVDVIGHAASHMTGDTIDLVAGHMRKEDMADPGVGLTIGKSAADPEAILMIGEGVADPGAILMIEKGVAVDPEANRMTDSTGGLVAGHMVPGIPQGLGIEGVRLEIGGGIEVKGHTQAAIQSMGK